MRLTVRILGTEVLHLTTDPDPPVEQEDMRGSATSERVENYGHEDALPPLGFMVRPMEDKR